MTWKDELDGLETFLPTLKRTCFHEAGHAVVEWALKIPIKYIMIEIKADEGGTVDLHGSTKVEIDQSGAPVMNFLILFGGIAAELEFYGEFDSDGGDANGDLQHIKEALHIIQEGQRQNAVQDALMMGRQLVKTHRLALERLANKLYNCVFANTGSFKMVGEEVVKVLSAT